MKILFHEQSLSERGTSVATYDYAFYAKKLLGVEPYVCYPQGKCFSNEVLQKYQNEFETFDYDDFYKVQRFANQNNVDFFYNIKFGVKIDQQILTNSKNLVHSVFNTDKSHVHGDVYAVVSEWMSKKTNYEIPYVPHMINLPDVDDDMRTELNIPKEAIVIGRYGATETFDLEFAWSSILMSLLENSNLWFLFANTPKVLHHNRCLYLNKIVNLQEKSKYINTCDAMLHARSYGETFGLSVLEFACKNKQIISYDNEELQNNYFLGGRNHFLFLENRCHKYENQEQLTNILTNLSKKNPFNTLDLNEKFSPKNVMNKFKEIFLC